MALSNLLESWDKEDKPESSSLLRRTLGDTAVSVAKGVANTGQAAVGLANIPTLGYAGKALDYTGYNPEQTNQFLEELYTPEQQAANQEVQNANGFTETLGAAVANPSTIYHGVVESLPLMLGGQAIAKGAMSAFPKLGRLTAGATGEGIITAGSQAEQIRQQTPDNLLTLPQVGYAAGSGAITGGITALSGGLANKLGVDDIDTAFLGGQGGTGSAVSRFLKGGLTEGILEEMPQSAQEQMTSNLALDKPVMEDVGNAAAQGALLGFAQGGVTGAVFGKNQQEPVNQVTEPTPIPPPEPQGALSRAVAQAPQLGQTFEKPTYEIKPNAQAIVDNRTIQGQPIQQAIDAQYQDNRYLPLGMDWQKPTADIKPNADAIVKNRTVQGADLQQAIDSQYQNDNKYNPLAGTWESPSYADRLSESEQPPVIGTQEAAQSGQFGAASSPIDSLHEKSLSSLKKTYSANRSTLDDEIKTHNEVFGAMGYPKVSKESLRQTKEELNPNDNYIDRAYEDLPLARNIGLEDSDKRAFFLPKAKVKGKTKGGEFVAIDNDYVLSMNGRQYLDLPRLTRDQAIELSKTRVDKNGKPVNQFFYVYPRAYVKHLGFEKVADKEGLLKTDNSNITPEQQPAKQPSTDYHPAVSSLANELVEGGGVSYVYDEYGKIKGRTPSVNPDWFKDGAFVVLNPKTNQPYKGHTSVKEIKQAVTAYEKGAKLTAKQQAILESLSEIANDLEESANNQQPANYSHEESLLDNQIQRLLDNGELSENELDDLIARGELALDDYDSTIPFDDQASLSVSDSMALLGFSQQEIDEVLNADSSQTNAAASIAGNERSEGEKLLDTYTNSDITEREAKQRATEKEQIAKDQAAERKRKADLEVDTLADEMLGIGGTTTADLFDLPSTNKAKPEKQKPLQPVTDRAIWIPKMTQGRLKKLLNKQTLTSDDIEDLKDYKYFLINQKQDAYEKGFYDILNADRPKGAEIPYVLKDKFLLTNIEYKIEEAEKSAKQNPNINDDYDDTIPFSKSKPAERPHTSKQSLIQAMRKALDRVFGGGWFSQLLATGKFKVVSRADVQSMGISPNAQAFYNPKDDTTYFVYDNIDQRTDLVKLSLHELGVHALQMGKDSKGFENILNQVGNLAKNSKNPIIQRAVKAAKDANTPANLMNEEIAGYLVEFHPKLSISQKILAWFRSQLRKLGITKINEKDVVYMASQALRNAPSDLLFDEPTRKEGIRESYAGQKAKNADKSALARAVEMEQQGVDMETIRKDTGWFLGMDDKWRFEISDKDMKVKKDFMSKLSDYDKEMLKQYDWWSPTILLNDLINHEQLKNNYPDIFNHTTVELKPDAKDASFDQNAGIITVPIKVEKNGNILIAANSLLHEIQHAIQSIEGFANGGNIQTQDERLAEIRAANQKYYDVVLSNPNYQNTVARINKAYEDGDIEKAKRLLPYAEKIATVLSDGKDLVKALDNAFLSPEEKYRRLAGEIEARDTAARMNMTAEQRRNTTPYVSQGIPKEDAIVRFGDGVAMSASSEEQRQYKEVEARYFNEDGTPKAGAMLAPNGQPTNLNKMQWIQVRTPNFIKWFGDWINDPENASKVVDENGEPLVVYHGSNQDFNTFERMPLRNGAEYGDGFYFTSDEYQANNYGGVVKPYFLSLVTPFDPFGGKRDKQRFSDKDKAREFFNKKLVEFRELGNGYDRFKPIVGQDGNDFIIDYAVEYKTEPNALSDGYKRGNVFVAFNPNQIKSAIGNTGAFSQDNNDIRYSKSISTIPEKSLSFDDYEAMYNADFYEDGIENFGFKKALLFLNDVMKSNETTSQDYQKAKAEIDRLKTELSTNYQLLEFISYFKNVPIDEVASPEKDPSAYTSRYAFEKAVSFVKNEKATHVFKDGDSVYPLWKDGRKFYGEDGYIHEDMNSVIPIKEILNKGKQPLPTPEYAFKDKKQVWQFSKEEFNEAESLVEVDSQKIPLDEKVIGDDDTKTILGKMLNHNYSPYEIASYYKSMFYDSFNDGLYVDPDRVMADIDAYAAMLKDAFEEGYTLSFDAMQSLNAWTNDNGSQENRLIGNSLPQTKLWQLIYKNDLYGVLSEIKANGKTLVHKLLAARLLNNISNNLTIAIDYDLPTPDGIQAKGAYDKDGRVIYLNVSQLSNDDDLENVLLHELIHVATVDKTNIPKFHNELVRLQQLILNHLKKNPKVKKSLIPVIKEAMSNIDELVAYGLSHRDFQELLKDIQDTNSKKSVWSKFVDFVAKAIGFDLTKTNALSSLLSVSEDMILSKEYAANNNGLRYSIASPITDFFTSEPTHATTIDDIDTMLQTGRQPRRDTGLQYWKDKVVTAFTDATRPFERFISDNFPAELASAILSGSDRALGMKAAFEREAMNLFGRDIGKAIRAIQKANPKFDYKTAKDLAGTWLSVRYAPIANDWLMQKDQQRVDDLIAQGAPQKEINKAKEEQAKRIAAINDPKIIDVTKQPSDAGLAGGYNNATAQHLKTKIESEIDVSLLEKLADHVYDMNEWKLKQDIKNGKISQATADKFPKSRFYVPLTGDPRTDESLDDVFSVGNVNQAKDRTIGGRTTSLAQNGIDASFEQLEKSARYHGWKDFKDAIENAYSQLINDKLAQGKTQKEAEAEVWEENQIKRRAEDGFIGENDIVVRKDGKGMIYTINNQAAMEALRNANNEDVPSILKPIAYLTRLQARLVTQFMPLFAPTNMIRDVAERSENIRTRKIEGFNGDMNQVANDSIKNAGRLLTKMRSVMMPVLAEHTYLEKAKIPLIGLRLMRDVDNTDTDVQQLKQFLALGGSSTYGDILSNDSKKLSDKLKATGTIPNNVMEAIHLYNNAFEMISGFSIYQSLVKQGLDERKAATTALNLMNFRKRGKYMNPIRALYMFAQPIATGGHQLAKTLTTKRGLARFAAYTVAAALLYSLLRSGDDDDELGINKMDEQGNFTLYRNILIPMGDGQYFKVPVGFGMQQLAWSHGVNFVRMAAGSMTPAETAAESIALWTKAAAPIAPAETAVLKHPLVWATQTFTPQIAKPIVNSALDVNAFGSPLTNARYEKEDKAKALQGRRDTPEWYKMAAEELARSTNGKVDMYPEQIRELLRGYGAGVGNEMLKWTIENPAKKERGLKTTSPLFDRYIQQSNDDSLKTRLYYRKRELMNELEVKQSVGEELTPEEQKLVELNDELKKMESRARGKLSAARKAERLKQMAKANNLTKQADNIKQRYMGMALTARA